MKTVYTAGVLATCLGIGALAALAGRAVTPATAQNVPPAHVAMVIVPGVRLGPDHKMHDAFTPTALTALAGQTLVITVYNYDTGPHSFMAPALHLNVLIPAAHQKGVPAIQTFRFSVRQAGVYHWHCMMPCDDAAQGWAMAHLGYMAGTITIQRA